jgi:hypothetical protein
MQSGSEKCTLCSNDAMLLIVDGTDLSNAARPWDVVNTCDNLLKLHQNLKQFREQTLSFVDTRCFSRGT